MKLKPDNPRTNPNLLDIIHFNLLHEFRYPSGAMQAENENSATVVGKALLLLSLVVLDFIET